MTQVEKLQSEPDWGAVLNLRHIGTELLGESQVIWGSRARAWLGTESWSCWGEEKRGETQRLPSTRGHCQGTGKRLGDSKWH